MTEQNVTAAELQEWLDANHKTGLWLSEVLGVSRATVSRWLNEHREIPAPEEKLVRLLIRGEMPFSFSVRPNIMRFTPQEWRAIEILRIREGFETSHDWIAAKIRAYLAMSKTTGVRYPTADEEEFTPSSMVADAPKEEEGNGTDGN